VNFFDTNILVYAVSNEGFRTDRSIEVLSEGGIISAQVLNEFTNATLKKMNRRWADVDQALKRVELVVSEIVPFTRETHQFAFRLARAHMLQWFDAVVLASALEAGCDTLYTEDFQGGRKFGKLKIVNPYV
jgi:predicted nucleic acid-binding protein